MTLRQRLGAVVCFFRGCDVEFQDGYARGAGTRHRWFCRRCGHIEYTLTAEEAWREMTKDWGK